MTDIWKKPSEQPNHLSRIVFENGESMIWQGTTEEWNALNFDGINIKWAYWGDLKASSAREEALQVKNKKLRELLKSGVADYDQGKNDMFEVCANADERSSAILFIKLETKTKQLERAIAKLDLIANHSGTDNHCAIELRRIAQDGLTDIKQLEEK